MKSTLEYITIQTNLKHNILKINISLQEIQERNPGRTDLINSMEETRDDLLQILEAWNGIAVDLTASIQRCHSLEIQVQQLINENEKLTKTNQNLINETL